MVDGTPSLAVRSGSGSGSGSPSGSPSGTGSPSGPTPTGSVTWGESTGDISNLMPLISAGNSTANGNLVTRVLDGLYRSAPNIQYIPDVDQGTASSAVVGGKQVVTVKINPRAVWADGQPITAADYVFTAEAQKSSDPSNGGCAALLSTVGFDQIETAEAVDERTATFTFKAGQSFADWKGLFSGNSALLLSKHVVDQGSARATCDYITRGWPVRDGIPLGAQNGPWLITGDNVDVAARTITLVPNPRYWGDKPKLAKLVFKTIGFDSDTQLRALQTEDVDIVYPQPQLDLVANLKKLSGIKTEIGFGASFEHLDFNTRDPLLKYKQVRQAIALAIDRDALVRATVGQFSDTASVLGNRIVLTSQRGYQNNGAAYDRQDIAKAKQLIRSVGGKLGSDGIYRIGGRPLSFRITTTQDNPLRDVTVSRIAAQVRAAGIKITEFANPDIFQGPEKPTSLAGGGFQIALFAWVGSPSLSSSNSIYYSPAKTRGAVGQNYSRAGTTDIDTQLDKVTTAYTPDAQLAAANAADKLLWGEMYTLPLYQKPTLLAYRNDIQGLADNATFAGPLWNSDDFTVR
ncbi:ABC transporter family substrate-binding protein [Jatrophihabitans fulvus]